MTQEEHYLQAACVRWFMLQHTPLFDKGLLFAVPNGGARSKATAGKLKAEGVMAGVADLILLVPRHGWHGLCIEMKTAKGVQSPQQRRWQQSVSEQFYRYEVVRSLEQFVETVNHYLEP